MPVTPMNCLYVLYVSNVLTCVISYLQVYERCVKNRRLLFSHMHIVIILNAILKFVNFFLLPVFVVGGAKRGKRWSFIDRNRDDILGS
jgi:hypothetical protein